MSTNHPPSERAEVYRTASTPVIHETNEMALTPTDRVRWASILAGLFTVLATLVFLTVLGVALGLSTFDANNPRSFGIGAGIYGIISALIAFAFGGFIASSTAGAKGRGNAILQSGMVWIVTIALIVNFIGSGVGTLLNLAGGAANTAIVAGSNVAGSAAQGIAANSTLQATVEAGATQAAPAIQATAGAIQNQVQQQLSNVSPQDVETAAHNASSAAWWALLGLGISAVAAIGGGLLGTRRQEFVAETRRTTA